MELRPFDLKSDMSHHCRKVHQRYKFGANPPSIFQGTVQVFCMCARTDARMDMQ